MKRTTLLNWVSLSALVIGAPSIAHAQEADVSAEARDVVIVTARKREENIQEIPAVVSSLSSERLEDLGGATNTRELVQLLPGVTFIDGASSTVSEPNIRGAGQARLPNSDAAIGLYRDGAYIAGGNLGGRALQRFDLFDIERVEVLRGPQGALYGRNAVGGAINVISQKPLFEDTGFVNLSYGDNETLGGQAVLNQKLTDGVAIRVGGDYTNQTGCIYTRADTGACFDRQVYGAGRAALRWQPTDALDIIWTSDYSDTHADSGGAVLQRTTTLPIDVVGTNAINDFTVDQSSHTLQIAYDLDWAELFSTTSYRRRDSSLYSDPDGLVTATQQDRRTDATETTFQEVRLQGEAGDLNWLVGADLFYLKNDYLIQERGRANIVNAMTMTSVNPNSDLRTQSDQKSYSAYGSVEYRIDALTLGAEARYSRDEKEAIVDAVTVTGAPRYVDFPPGSPQTRPSRAFDNTSGGVSASYKVTPDVLAFARASTAYRAGGFNSEFGNPCNAPGEVPGTSCNLVDVPPGYDPETSLTYELGLKTSWFDNALDVNINTYKIEYSDMLANLNNGIMAMQDPLNGAMFLANAGDAVAHGFEFEMVARPPLPENWGDLNITASYGSQDGEFKQPPAFLTTVQEGFSLARLRPQSTSANVVYRLPLGGDLVFNGSLTYRHESGGYQGAENDTYLDQYDIYGARVALRYRDWTFAIRAANLTDDRYFTNQSGATLRPGILDSYRLNDPRYVEASVSYEW